MRKYKTETKAYLYKSLIFWAVSASKFLQNISSTPKKVQKQQWKQIPPKQA